VLDSAKISAVKDEWTSEEDEDLDRILGQATGLLAQRADEQAVALLVDVQSMTLANTSEVVRTEKVWDPWTGDDTPATRTIYRREALFDVDEHLLPRFTDEVCARIARTLEYGADRNGFENVNYVRARPALPQIDEHWREAHGAELTKTRPSNQARRETGLADKPVEDGLTFGSAEELRVYRELKGLQARFPEDDTFAIAPLPGVRLRAGNTWSPDVLVMGRGRALVIEIDGPYHRGPRRYVDDRNRDLQWQRCGIPVIRLAVEDLSDDTALNARLREEIHRHLSRP
jgi:hypothetical protein